MTYVKGTELKNREKKVKYIYARNQNSWSAVVPCSALLRIKWRISIQKQGYLPDFLPTKQS